MSLIFRAAAAEVPGEEVFVARRGQWDFVIQKEPHRDDWAWIVLGIADAFPVDLGAVVASKDDAMKACADWYAQATEGEAS